VASPLRKRRIIPQEVVRRYRLRGIRAKRIRRRWV
jgi:hypothetical protein